jgi:hypothetical protein
MEGIDNNTGLLQPWMMISFKFAAHCHKALLFNGSPPTPPHKIFTVKIKTILKNKVDLVNNWA